MALMSSFLSAVAAVRGTSRQRVWPPEDYRLRSIIMPGTGEYRGEQAAARLRFDQGNGEAAARLGAGGHQPDDAWEWS
jgi:hypothetical protein